MSFARAAYSLSIALATAGLARGQVVTYEGRSFLDDEGWGRETFCQPERWIESGVLVQLVEPPLPECGGHRRSAIKMYIVGQ